MKKSHRKDVIIARIVFAIICLILIAIICLAVMFVRNHIKDKEKQQGEQVESQATEADGPYVDYTDLIHGSDTEEVPTETQEETPLMVKTTSGVNLRTEPNTNCAVVTVLAEGTVLELVGEEDGWAFVNYQGNTGYVSTDYLEEVTVNN